MRKDTLKMFKRILICCCSLGNMATLNAQNLDWVKQAGGAGAFVMSNAVVVDAAGNSYTTGTFNQTTDFDPGIGVASLTPAGGNDIFVLKLNAAGSFVWVQKIGGSGTDENSKGIAVDTAGNVFVTGDFIGTVDFDPGPGLFNLTTVNPSYPDVFVLKLNASGTLSWAKQYDGSSQDRGYGITVDHNGNVYTTGYFGLTADFNPGPGVNNLTANGGLDVYVCKLNNNGDYIWAKNFGGPNGDIGYAIAADDSGNVYLTGGFPGAVDFDPGIGISQLISVGEVDIFVSKLDMDGNFVWAKQMGGGFSSGRDITLDAFGNVYTTGFFAGISDFDPGAGVFQMQASGDNAIFISKFDVAGNFVWAKNIGGFDGAIGYSIATDVSANVYTAGRFYGSTDFDPSDTVTYNLSSITGSSFVSKLDSAGHFVWAKNMGGEISGLDLDASGSIYTAGQFYGTAGFDSSISLISIGSGDAFVLKLQNCSLLNTTISTTACDHFTLNGVTYTQSGTYNQTHVTANGCDSLLTLELVINHAPNIVVTQTGNTLSASTSDATYQWIQCSNGNAIISGATGQTYTPIANGSYAVIVTKNDCSDTSVCYDITTTGIYEPNENYYFEVYPNPVTGILTIATTQTLNSIDLKLIDVTGRVIKMKSNAFGNKFSMEMNDLTQGIYILEIVAEQKKSRIKLIKE